MRTVTQKARFRQAVINYAEKYGVTRSANRYDGTLYLLMDKSHRPHSHPNQHTEQELKLIFNMRRRTPHTGLVVLWVKLRQRGYTQSVTSLYRILIKTNLMPEKPPNPKYVPKPYEKMLFTGQRVQIDVKFVPSSCLFGEAKNQKFYQYTALDEYSRFRYVEAFKKHSSYSSTVFLEHLIKAFHFPIYCVQTDNGQEFTKRLSKTQNPSLTLFEKARIKHGILHKLIKPYTLRHNGKVERSNRKDNEYFYAIHTFYSFDDFKKQLTVHNKKYNHFPMHPLNWRSPVDYINSFLLNGELF